MWDVVVRGEWTVSADVRSLDIRSRGRGALVCRVLSDGVGFFFFSSRRRHTRFDCDWSSDVCSSDLAAKKVTVVRIQWLKSRTTVWSSLPADNQDLKTYCRLSRTARQQRRSSRPRSEERRVGKECRSRWSPYH